MKKYMFLRIGIARDINGGKGLVSNYSRDITSKLCKVCCSCAPNGCFYSSHCGGFLVMLIRYNHNASGAKLLIYLVI